MKSESELQAEIRLALGKRDDCVFWRNNTGVDERADGRFVRYGLAKGSADLIGIVDGRFCSLEIKTPRGKPSLEQRLWADLVRSRGGFACVVRSVDDAHSAIERCKRGALL